MRHVLDMRQKTLHFPARLSVSPLVALPASLITLCHSLATPTPSLSSDAWLRAIEHCLSAFAGFSDFPEVPLIWKLNDSTQCQNSWGTISELAVSTLSAFFSLFLRATHCRETQAQSDDYCTLLLSIIEFDMSTCTKGTFSKKPLREQILINSNCICKSPSLEKIRLSCLKCDTL